MIQSSNKLIVKDPFEMPAVNDTTVLVLRECADLVPHCWIWNESVGYLEVVTYSGYDIYVTVKNVGMKENATSGTIFPSCMEFLITAPNATPIIDNTVTCLRADFKCPTVGQEALMSVDSTSAIRKGDLIIVDTRYQYLVTEIINEHTMKVLNEEKGKEGGVIDVKCNECVPVKIFESTHCCEALQEQVDDIYSKFDIKKSIVPKTDSLISVTNGSNSLTDVFNDVVLDVDTDLSKYDNATSQFITLSDIPPIPTVNDATLTIYNSDGVTPIVSFSANAATAVTATLPAYGLQYFEESLSGGTSALFPKNGTATTSNLGTSTDSFSNVYTNVLHGGNGKSSYIRFDNDGSDIKYSNGSSTAYNAHAFFSGGKKLVAFAHDQVEHSTDIIPTTSSTYDIGRASSTWNNAYIDNLHINDVAHSEVASIFVQTAHFDFSSIIGVSNLWGSSHTIETGDAVIVNSFSHAITCLIDVDMFITRLRIAQETGTSGIDVSLVNYIEITNTTTSNTVTTNVNTWYAGRTLNQDVLGTKWYEVCPTFIYTNSINLDANCSYIIRAYSSLTFPGGNANTVCWLPGGVTQHGNMRIAMIVQ